ncbi:hypothetical protein ECG_01735 [Echinococcus granulosus]|uniref:Pfam-B_14132 domain containing protein n=1 Tax=Echinococcus granulosus TaxID=6210 RepID=A0A068W733_ECHGR|nr:hypothetical protein ECG_01735 [Echinococcus granulosus]CDS15320.1 Pfam-B_14132 domain containing protein [Echinococcus granulosus]
MFPRYFPYGQLPSVPNVNSLLGLSLGLPLDSTSIVSGQDISSLLLPAQPNLSTSSSLHAASPYFLPQTAQFLGGLPIPNAVNPLIAQLNLSQMLPLLNPGLLQQPTCDLTTTSSEPSDTHTIVRAPVLYGNSNGSTTSQVPSKEANKSPPDQIVASYAAAARAAAIAYQQPLSNAAEVFLSAAASAAGPLTNTSGYVVATAKNRTAQKRAPGVSCANSTSSGPKTSLAVAKSEGAKPPLPWNSAWTRIVDRQSDIVVYISPGGSRLKNVAEVRAHLERWLSAERAAAISDECINTSFCFDANREVRLVSAPDDSVFVFPEEVETSNRAPVMTDAPSPSAPLLPPSSAPSLPSKAEGSLSDLTGTAAPTSIAPDNEATTSISALTASTAVKRLASSPERTDGRNGAESTVLPSTSEAETNGATKKDESRQPKKAKVEPEPASVPQLLAPLPSLSNDVALTTSSFVARGMARAGGATTVVPSVVPSVLPPTSTTSSTSSAYALAQHLATLQQHQALLASAGLIHSADAAHQQQQQQLFEHYKQQHQQQAVAAAVAAALLLQQQQQHQLQLQQHLQTVYATALQQQQHQQALQQQHHQDGNQ